MSDAKKEERQPVTLEVLFDGSCACSRITYTCTSFPTCSSNCHCNICRKLSGGPYQTYADVQSKQVTFYDHKENLRYEGLPTNSNGGITFLRFSKAGERTFCVDCYTPLAMRYRHHADVIGITLGSVDEDTIKNDEVKAALKPTFHIFTSQMPWWVDQVEKDGLEVHQRFSSQGFEDDIKAWEGKEG